jgi:predicted DNA-binding protein (UPF0278 family)
MNDFAENEDWPTPIPSSDEEDDKPRMPSIKRERETAMRKYDGVHETLKQIENLIRKVYMTLFQKASRPLQVNEVVQNITSVIGKGLNISEQCKDLLTSCILTINKLLEESSGDNDKYLDNVVDSSARHAEENYYDSARVPLWKREQLENVQKVCESLLQPLSLKSKTTQWYEH